MPGLAATTRRAALAILAAWALATATTVAQAGPATLDRARAPAWLRHAAPVPAHAPGAPMIAVVIDDLGVARDSTSRVISLPASLTLAFMPYAPDLFEQTTQAWHAGHELLLHLPMEPEDAAYDPGPGALTTDLDEAEIGRRVRDALNRFDALVGVNNHMGSRFTKDDKRMTVVLREVKARGLLFLDSRTTGETVGERIARELGIPTVRRDVFIDNQDEIGDIQAQLALLEQVAREQGHAVGIAHPRPETLRALEQWLPAVRRRGFVLVPVSAIAAQTLNGARAAVFPSQPTTSTEAIP